MGSVLTFMIRKQKNGKLETVLIMFGIIVGLVTSIGGWILKLPYVYATTKDGLVFKEKVEAFTPVTLAYTHSVQKTMIYEYLEVNQTTDGFVLKSTKYQSMGVGLPFSKEDGDFREENGWFILDNMNRRYPKLSLRNGVTNHGTLTIGNKTWQLDEVAPLGEEITLKVAPLYEEWYMKK